MKGYTYELNPAHVVEIKREWKDRKDRGTEKAEITLTNGNTHVVNDWSANEIKTEWERVIPAAAGTWAIYIERYPDENDVWEYYLEMIPVVGWRVHSDGASPIFTENNACNERPEAIVLPDGSVADFNFDSNRMWPTFDDFVAYKRTEYGSLRLGCYEYTKPGE
jgi:hypothetical protein